MAALLKINGNDYSAYLDITDEGFDPVNPDRISPQFGGSLAFSEGQPYVRDSAGNREWHLPLKLKAATTDALFALVRQLKGDLCQGKTVEFKPDGASQSTFFDLERGKVDEQYQHFLQRAGWLRCTLKMWTRPHGHTGTTRLVASAAVASGPVIAFATGVLGDVAAGAQIDLFVGASQHRPFSWMVGIRPNATTSYQPLIVAASMSNPAGGASIMGSGTALASQFWAGQAGQVDVARSFDLGVGQGQVYVGRHRVFAIARGVFFPASAVAMSLTLTDPHNRTLSPGAGAATAYPTYATASQWGIFDLGEVTIQPSVIQMLGLTVYHQNVASIASAVQGASSFQLNALYLLPVDYGAYLLSEGPAAFPAAQEASWAFIASGEMLRVQSYPSSAVIRFAAGGSVLDGAPAGFRGDSLTIPPIGSPAASGPVAVVALAGMSRDLAAAGPSTFGFQPAPLTLSVSVRERFSFFR